MITNWLLINASQNPQNLTGFPTTGSLNSVYFVLIFFAIIVTIRIYRGVNGRAYSTYGVLRLPVVYVILTLITILAVGTLDPILVATLALIPAGFLLGYRFGTKVRFFNRNNRIYYARSPIIMVIWLISFILRLVVEEAIKPSITVFFIVDLILCATTGVLIGEALNIVHKKREYEEIQKNGTTKDNEFRING